MWNFVFTISKHSGESTETFHSPDLTCEARKPALGFYCFTKKELPLGVVSNLPSDHIEVAIEPILDLAIQIPKSVV